MGNKKAKRAYLVLADGTVFHGYSMGAAGETVGEVVFNTCTASYQSLLSDPTYYGQIVAQTYPSTVMTDKGLADQIYLEPLNIDIIKRIIEKEKPDSILPTVGGNLALELGLGLSMNGFLEEHQVRLLGVSPEIIHSVQDRQSFVEALRLSLIHI